MYYLLIAIYVIICIFLISTILLQAGRGGGLTESFGGTAESILGTQAPVLLKRATEVSAALFIVIALVLALMSSRRGQSLFDQMRMPSSSGVPAGAAANMPLEGTQETSTGETGSQQNAAPQAAESSGEESLPE